MRDFFPLHGGQSRSLRPSTVQVPSSDLDPVLCGAAAETDSGDKVLVVGMDSVSCGAAAETDLGYLGSRVPADVVDLDCCADEAVAPAVPETARVRMGHGSQFAAEAGSKFAAEAGSNSSNSPNSRISHLGSVTSSACACCSAFGAVDLTASSSCLPAVGPAAFASACTRSPATRMRNARACVTPVHGCTVSQECRQGPTGRRGSNKGVSRPSEDKDSDPTGTETYLRTAGPPETAQIFFE